MKILYTDVQCLCSISRISLTLKESGYEHCGSEEINKACYYGQDQVGYQFESECDPDAFPVFLAVILCCKYT